MESEQMAEIERLKKANEEMGQRMDQLMDMMTALLKDKIAAGSSHDQGRNEEVESVVAVTQAAEGEPVNVAIPPATQQQQVGGNPYPTMAIPPQAIGPAPALVPAPTFIPPPIPTAVPLFNQGIDTKRDESMENSKMFSLLDERLKLIEGFSYHPAMNAIEVSLVPGLVIPPKFKVPDFEKFSGTSCPKDHLLSYVRKMAAHTYDDKLMIHFFQDSLTGAVSRWYNQLDSTKIRTWSDLTKAFLTQYKHMIDLAPDRLTLQTMEKKSNETFKEYAQRWRDKAAQVYPPLTDKEANYMFLETLRAPYYDRLIASTPKDFFDLILSGELIEKAIKTGRLDAGDAK